MKKRLNKSGIDKVVTYLGEDKFTTHNINGLGDLLLGNFSEDDVSRMSGININVEHIGAGLHKVYHITEEDIGIDDQNTQKDDLVEPSGTETPESLSSSKNLSNLVAELTPILAETFPTKEQVNIALNDLKAQMIDPEEMMNILRMQIKTIKKQSRQSDEVG